MVRSVAVRILSTTARRCASGPASASSCTSWRRRWRTGRDAPGDEIALFTSSWKDRPAPASRPNCRRRASSIAASRCGRSTWAWNRSSGRRSSGWPGRATSCTRQSPLLIPARARGAGRHHPRSRLPASPRAASSAEMRRDYPGAGRDRTPRARTRSIVSSHYAAGEVHARAERRPPTASTSARPGARRGRTRCATRRSRASRGEHILFIGTLEPRKNVGALLEAYARLRARLPDAPPLVLAGASHAGVGAAGQARRAAAAARGPRRRSPATSTRRGRMRSLCATRACWCCRPTRKASACRCSRPWPAACRWWSRSAARCPKSRATPPTPVDPDDADGFAARDARRCSTATSRAAATERGLDAGRAATAGPACADGRARQRLSRPRIGRSDDDRHRRARALRPARPASAATSSSCSTSGRRSTDARRHRVDAVSRTRDPAVPPRLAGAGRRLLAGSGGTLWEQWTLPRAVSRATGPTCSSRRATLLR